MAAGREVKDVLKRSCYDCHSNQTRWPWYSKIAPVSFLIAKDVNTGRKHLNFSEWGFIEDQNQMKKEILKEIENGDMPPTLYNITHPRASLSVFNKENLKKWVKGQFIY